MLVLRPLNSENGGERVDILGITTDDLHIIVRSLENMIKTSGVFNPKRVQRLIRQLNDDFTFIDVNVDDIPMYPKNNGIETVNMVDLGLPSGTLWADRNVGADSPEDYGDYFRFGETTPYTKDSPFYEYDEIVGDIAGTDKDAATVILGGQFRMPTIEQFKELVTECSREWTEVGGIKGVKVTGPNGNSIFLPAGDFRRMDDGSFGSVSSYGYYWSASPNGSSVGHGLNMYFKTLALCSYDRGNGFSVRAVCKR